MLQLCDKGAILFADRYLQNHFSTSTSEEFDEDRVNCNTLGPLVKAIILDNAGECKPGVAQRALLLIK